MDKPTRCTYNAAGALDVHVVWFVAALRVTAGGIKLPAFIILIELTGQIPPKVVWPQHSRYAFFKLLKHSCECNLIYNLQTIAKICYNFL